MTETSDLPTVPDVPTIATTLRALAEQCAKRATERSQIGDRDGDFYARGCRDAYAVAAMLATEAQEVTR